MRHPQVGAKHEYMRRVRLASFRQPHPSDTAHCELVLLAALGHDARPMRIELRVRRIDVDSSRDDVPFAYAEVVPSGPTNPHVDLVGELGF